MNYKKKLLYSGIGIIVGAVLVLSYKGPTQVDKIEYRDKVVTRIVERKDGTKVTEIVKDTTRNELHTKPKQKEWLLGPTVTFKPDPVYGVSIYKRQFMDFYIGGSINADGDWTLGISYSF